MFTGIVEEVGRVRSVGNGCIEIAAAKVTEGTAVGDSIAVNGVCLTVVAFTRDGFTADMMPVTLERTALGKLRAGDGVNLERALTFSSRLGGHIVSGHIDGVGRVKSVEAKDNARILRVEAASTILRYIVPRGSVALDGVSLTVAEIGGKKAAQVMIISGCQESGNGVSDFPDWKQNLVFALLLQQKMEQTFPGLTRPVFFSPRRYNMHLSHCSLLLEVGSDSNTLEEACYTGRLIGRSLGLLLEDYLSEDT